MTPATVAACSSSCSSKEGDGDTHAVPTEITTPPANQQHACIQVVRRITHATGTAACRTACPLTAAGSIGLLGDVNRLLTCVGRFVDVLKTRLKHRSQREFLSERLPDKIARKHYVFLHIPKGQCTLFWHAVLRRSSLLSRTFGCGARKGAVGSLRCMS